jgi:hypothetical protein
MHRTDADGHVANLFSDGDPGVPTPGTLVEEAWLNAVQEELANYIESTGIALVKNTNTQLTSAIAATITALKAAANTWALAQTYSKGQIVTQSTANTVGVTSAGNGTGAGVAGTGGDTAGAAGVTGLGGVGGGAGVSGVGRLTGSGVSGIGGVTDGAGVTGLGTAAGAGVQGQSLGTGVGGTFLKGATGGTVGITTDGTLKFTGANPASTVGLTGEFSQMNMARAWGRLTISGGAVTVDSGNGAGANVASATVSAGGTGTSYITVTLTLALGGNGAGWACGEGFFDNFTVNASGSTVTIQLQATDATSGTRVVNFGVFGR